MSTIITPSSAQATRAMLHFIEQSFNNIAANDELISMFILNALYGYSNQVLEADLTFVQTPCPPEMWKHIAKRFHQELQRHVQPQAPTLTL